MGLVGYFSWTFLQGWRESAVATAEEELAEREIQPDAKRPTYFTVLKNLVLVAVGLALLVYGAEWLVAACVSLAKMFGVSDLIIGLTIVAIGTSLPELMTSLMASMRGHRDLAVGNVVGSNILNVLCVLGLSSIVAPAGIDVDRQSLVFDIPVMIAFSLVAGPVFLSGLRISRGEGIGMVLYYVAYLGFLIWLATRGDTTVTSYETMLFLAPLIPLVIVIAALARRGKG